MGPSTIIDMAEVKCNGTTSSAGCNSGACHPPLTCHLPGVQIKHCTGLYMACMAMSASMSCNLIGAISGSKRSTHPSANRLLA